MRETFGFEHRDRVRHTRTGAIGTVHLWDFDPREPDAAEGEVRWDNLTVADELGVVAPHLARLDDEPDTTRFTPAAMAAFAGNVLGGRFPVEGRWHAIVAHRGIDLAEDDATVITIQTEGGQRFTLTCAEITDE